LSGPRHSSMRNFGASAFLLMGSREISAEGILRMRQEVRGSGEASS